MIALLAAVAVAAPAVDTSRFRYERTLRPAGAGPALVVPDAPLLAHTRPGFPDLRIVDAGGVQVPWRTLPQPSGGERHVRVLDAGRSGEGAVAILDLGRGRRVVDHVTLDLPRVRFDGLATVSGSDDRRTWTRFPATEVYDVGGAHPARSTTVLLPETDYRYLEVLAPVRILGATVSRAARPALLRPLRARVSVGGAEGTVVTVDLGYPNVPVDELRISAATARYDRPFDVLVGDRQVAAGTLARVGPPRVTRVPLAVRARRLRIAIHNGDSPPLRGIRVEALARPRTLLVEGGHRGPLTLYYGGAVAAPSYDFARLPRTALALDRARPAALGPERHNAAYAVVDTRSFVERHRSLVTAALALAAAAVIGVAALALRRT